MHHPICRQIDPMGGQGRDDGVGAIGDEAAVTLPPRCGAVHRALMECHRRAGDQRQRSILCRHLNRSLAECVVVACFPEESEAVRSLCSSAGTSLKRSQCQRAQLALSVCLSSHQSPD